MIINQVNRIAFKRNALNHIFRLVHREASGSTKKLFPLENRKLLKITGEDASVFLQGLITNDMRHFEEGAKSMYAMFLNNKGRVMYDTLIHKWNEDNQFLIECDKNVLNLLQKHLKLYKLKRLIDIQDINDQFRLWALIAPVDSLTELILGTTHPDITIYKDPRITDLGFRVITKTILDGPSISKKIGDDIVPELNEDGYKDLRYRLGVSEGADDLPPGTSFPLEANCDYLHGVSFHKGCYIGQELTARVHHTGVIRKRIMPLIFEDTITDNLAKDTVITAVDNPKSNLGKFKVALNNVGLGLIRIKEAIDAKVLSVGQYKATTLKPEWWPKEAPKDKINVLKTE